MRAVMTFIVIALIFSSITMLLWEGAIDVAAGRMTGGSIAAFVFTGVLVAGAFGALTEVYGDLLRGSGAAGRIGELLAAKARNPRAGQSGRAARTAARHAGVRECRVPLPDPARRQGGPRSQPVGRAGRDRRRGRPVGRRQVDPVPARPALLRPAGRPRPLDGVDLRDADPAAIRERIALVPQDTVIFAASARDNLRYGKWDASEEEILAAAKAANAHEFIAQLPGGYDSFLGEGGARLSGGQRQRIAIARALLRDSPLLLLDEATSALDAESERLVQDALERLMQTRTTIVIAHRLATVRAADRIIVMDGGRIVEDGTHASLSAADGLYASLARLQFEGMAA